MPFSAPRAATRTVLSSTWVAEIDTLGDTLVVRTVSGSVWDSVATLVPVFQIGELEGRDEYLFGDIEGLAVDSAGAIWGYVERSRLCGSTQRTGRT